MKSHRAELTTRRSSIWDGEISLPMGDDRGASVSNDTDAGPSGAVGEKDRQYQALLTATRSIHVFLARCNERRGWRDQARHDGLGSRSLGVGMTRVVSSAGCDLKWPQLCEIARSFFQQGNAFSTQWHEPDGLVISLPANGYCDGIRMNLIAYAATELRAGKSVCFLGLGLLRSSCRPCENSPVHGRPEF